MKNLTKFYSLFKLEFVKHIKNVFNIKKHKSLEAVKNPRAQNQSQQNLSSAQREENKEMVNVDSNNEIRDEERNPERSQYDIFGLIPDLSQMENSQDFSLLNQLVKKFLTWYIEFYRTKDFHQ